MSRVIFFQSTWRLDDNPMLVLSHQEDAVPSFLIGVIDSSWSEKKHGFKQRSETFINSSKNAAFEFAHNISLLDRKIDLYCAQPFCLLREIFDNTPGLTHCRLERPIAINEQNIFDELTQLYPLITFELIDSNFLYTPDQINIPDKDYRKSFTNFKKSIDATSPNVGYRIESIPANIIDPPRLPFSTVLSPPQARLSSQWYESSGEAAALQRLNFYLYESNLILSYKKTRNQLLGTDFSAKLSPFLAHGAVSPRRIHHSIESYEKSVESNESTYWLKYELLWRDFFRHVMLNNQSVFFRQKGFNAQLVEQGYDPLLFNHWSTGNTESDFVNANMIELNQTGYMSNRGRQIVASYLINELSLDWRFGAYYFQSTLIDYDVSSNWCNWAYLAGAGNDPRKRHFNVIKQQQTYDSDRRYTSFWLSNRS